MAPSRDLRLSSKTARKAAADTAGSKWYNLPATQITDEVKKELRLLRLRGTYDPKRFYKVGSGVAGVQPVQLSLQFLCVARAELLAQIGLLSELVLTLCCAAATHCKTREDLRASWSVIFEYVNHSWHHRVID